MRLTAVFISFALVMAACTDSTLTAGDTSGQADSFAVDAPVDAVSPTDTASPDAQDAGTDLGQSACEEGDGCFGESCDEADDCLSGICTMHMGEKVCSKTCDATCPDGWTCQLVVGAGDSQYVCVSNTPNLCLPCADAGDCQADVGAIACLRLGEEGSFCGGACDASTPCPEGYGCQEADTVSGTKSFQCVPESGICECTEQAISSGLATPCERSNDVGTCEGLRVCQEGGLSACDAVTPAEEKCNGIDDDCNGLIDEFTCDDGEDCTVDSCQGEAGCTHEPQDAGECLDGDVCTIADHCEAGICVGTPVDCDDGSECTEDACDGLGGCAFTEIAALCDDGDPCTLGDFCQDGTCEGNVALQCDDSNPCTDDSCGEGGCLHGSNDLPCDDGNVCTADDACAGGTCGSLTLLDCDDANACTNDTCNPAQGCFSAPNNISCDDGDACSLGDHCEDSGCVAGGDQLVCVDGNPCTDDSCLGDWGCVFTPNDAACDDKNDCTMVDSCVVGACLGAGSMACDDANPCTIDSCLLDGGCDHTVVGGPCSDGDPCTMNDGCVNGECLSGAPFACDDGNPCTDDACDPESGCAFTANDAGCSDGNACTQGDGCQGGACVGQGAAPCNDGNSCTQDFCHPQLGCQASPVEGPCNDGNACTLVDQCDQGSCVGSQGPACDDGNPCTADSCDPAGGCQFDAKEGACDDGDACTSDDACSDGVCAPGAPIACDDDLFCNGVESCDPVDGCQAGVPPLVDDDLACTTDSCDEEADQVINDPDNDACNVEGLCQVPICDPVQGCQAEVVLNCCGNSIVEDGEQCDDGNSLDGDGCDNTCGSEGCFDDWLVGTPCNGVDYGNGCSPQDTGYHYVGIVSGYACFWHHKNQAWNTSPASNFWHLAEQFGVTPGTGKCSWCHDKFGQPSPDGYSDCAGYFQKDQVGAWGWCAESDPNSVGFVCIPTEGNDGCP